MSEMVDRVAKALASTDGRSKDWDKHIYRSWAYTAIKAMNRPSTAMIAVGAGYIGTHTEEKGGVLQDANHCYQGMIEQALE